VGGDAGRVGDCEGPGAGVGDRCSSSVIEETLREERHATNSGIDTEDRRGWESTNSVTARCTSESGTQVRAVLVSVAASEAEGLAARGSAPGMFGVL
jgi:hypothetical protein